MAWVEKVGRRWRGCYRDADGKKRSMVHSTRTDAKNWAADREAEVRGGTWVDPRSGTFTVAAYADRWLRTYRQSRGRADQVERTLRRHILPTLGHVPMRTLTPRVLQAWVNDLTDTGAAPTSVRNYAATLASILNAAVDDDVLTRSPFRKVTLPALDIDQRRFLEPEEADRLIQEIPDRYKALIILALASGARWGELVGLRRHRYDWRKGTITITETLRELNGAFTTGPPKTRRSQRVIPLPSHAVAALNDHLVAYDVAADALIFTTPQGTPLSRANFRARVFAPACARARIHGLRFHDLRHSSASWLLGDGIPIVLVSQRLGHASVSMTLNVYAHTMPASEDRLLAVLDGCFAWGKNGADSAPNIAPGNSR